MDARRSRRRRRRRLAKEEEVGTAAKDSSSSPPSIGSSSSPPSIGSSSSSSSPPSIGFSSSSSSSSSSSPPSIGSSSSSSSCTAQRKIPLSDWQQQPDPDPDARARRPLLLSQIRSYYLDAISRLPAAELRTTLARGLLVGGHCYGPLHPVHNIIVNAVWYAAAFPFRHSDPIDVDVITSEGIIRLAQRSLDGLVASLRHHCPALSRDDALWHLCLSGADIHGAATSARGAVPFGRTKFKLEPGGAEVAAQAARHLKPAAFALFTTTVLPAVERAVLSLLAGRRSLSSTDILHLSAMLLPFPMPDVLPPPPPSPRERSQKAIKILDEKRRVCRIWYQNVLDIADAALRKYAHQTGAHYQLHTIYGLNILNKGGCLYQYFHVNFMAWPVRNQSSCQAPVRFFAEASNPTVTGCCEEEITLCCPLQAQPSPAYVDGCYVCALANRIVDHPDTEKHFGLHPYKTIGTKMDRDCPSTVDVDFRFFDPDRDIDFVEDTHAKIAMIEPIIPKVPTKLRSQNPVTVAISADPRNRCKFWAPSSSDEEDDDDDENDEIRYIPTR